MRIDPRHAPDAAGGDDAGDAELRRVLRRRQLVEPMPDPVAALTSMRPALARVRRRRLAARAAAASVTLLLSGAGVLALKSSTAPQIRTSEQDMSIFDASSTTIGVPLTTAVRAADEGDSAQTPGLREPGDDGAEVEHRSAPESMTSTTAALAVPESTPPTPIGPRSGDEQRSDNAPPIAPGSPTDDAAPETERPSSPPGIATTTTAAAGNDPGITTSTTAPAAEWVTCRCGSVLVDRSSGSIVVDEVQPADGYGYRLEDPDHGSVTVQFTGGTGEDCELVIPGPGGPEPG
jgi:hypothetical protein